MYSKPACSFCDKARKILTDSKVDVKEIDLNKLKTDQPKEASAIINGLVYTTRQTSVPQVGLVDFLKINN